jgi:hypothetical protein
MPPIRLSDSEFAADGCGPADCCRLPRGIFGSRLPACCRNPARSARVPSTASSPRRSGSSSIRRRRGRESGSIAKPPRFWRHESQCKGGKTKAADKDLSRASASRRCWRCAADSSGLACE